MASLPTYICKPGVLATCSAVIYHGCATSQPTAQELTQRHELVVTPPADCRNLRLQLAPLQQGYPDPLLMSL